MFELPIAITIGNKQFPIRNKGDYRMVLDCFATLNDTELDEKSRAIACLIIFYDGMRSEEDLVNLGNIDEALKAMFDFFDLNRQDVGAKSQHKLIDWEKDEQLIVSAINNVAKTEVRALPYLHWWTFMGYYSAIGESPLSTIIGIRDKIAKGKKLEKYEKEYRKNNPQYFNWDFRTEEQKEADRLVAELWNKGK